MMDINLDNLKDEFEAFSRCEVNQSNEDKMDDEGGFIVTVQKYLLPPAICGVYLSRLDIQSDRSEV